MPYRSYFCILIVLSIIATGCGLGGDAPSQDRPPNVVVIFTDDQGYGDVGSFGHPTIETPHLDRMTREGMKLTSFYVAASVCTPSRAALLTGRLPVRSGMTGVLGPNSTGGLPSEEVTLAEMLKDEGYATAAIGKWHLGHLPEYLPTEHGFDTYFGIPYSNDMDRTDEAPDVRAAHENPRVSYWNVPLMRGKEVIERPADQRTITRRYTEEAVGFIRQHREEPFFLYLAHSLPHVPLFRSEAFAGVSARGLYGDVIEEIDWSAGQVLETLQELELDEQTLVIFTSDNGPWLTYDELAGSAGLLRGGKRSTWDGGMRVPAIAWWPGTIEAGSVSHALTSAMDIFPTAVSLAGGEVPDDRTIDGQNLLPILTGETDKGRDRVMFYRGDQLYAVRKGPWKAHFVTQRGYGGEPTEHNPPLLYHMEHDPSEQYNRAEERPDILEEINGLVDEHKSNIRQGQGKFP